MGEKSTYQKLQKLIKKRKLLVAIGILIIILIISISLEYSNNIKSSYSSSNSLTSFTTSTIPDFSTTIVQSNTIQSQGINSSSGRSTIPGCSSCYGLFLYTVNQGDTISSISSHYGLSYNSIALYNNISSVFAGEQILLPFYADTIKTEVPDLPNQNKYDYYILSYAVTLHLNPMLIKAEVYDESSFNNTAISAFDSPPGVCGTGHSYGLLQYTPTCFSNISSFGVAQNISPNAEVLYGQNNGSPIINCTSVCSNGDYFVSEFSSTQSKSITSDLVEYQNYTGWNNSVFNPTENLFTVMQIESTDIQSTIVGSYYSNCSYAQYNEMALAQYQQSTPYVINGCGIVNQSATSYVTAVLYHYSKLIQYSSYGWTYEY